MPTLTTPAVLRRYIALEMARLRKAMPGTVKQEDVAKVIDTSQTRIAHFESGRNVPKLHELKLLLEFYGAPELAPGMQELVLQLREAGSMLLELDTKKLELTPGFDMYLGLEQGASRIFSWDAMIVKGILQCRPYAEAVWRGDEPELSDDEVARRVDLRMLRQHALDRTEARPDLVAVIDESVLHRQVGGPEVLAAQLDYLLKAAKRPNVALRVLPYSVGAHPAVHGPFTVLTFPIERDPGVVYLEDRIGGRARSEQEVIDEYVSVADRLLQLAQSERDSLATIRKLRKEVAT